MEEITTWAKKHWRHRIFKPCISNIQKCCWLLWSQVEKSSLGCWIHRSKFLEIMKAASFGVKWNSCIQSVTNIDFQTRHLRQHHFQRQPCLPQQENAETYSACLTTAWPHNNECRHYTGQTSLDPPPPPIANAWHVCSTELKDHFVHLTHYAMRMWSLDFLTFFY